MLRQKLPLQCSDNPDDLLVSFTFTNEGELLLGRCAGVAPIIA